MYRVRILKAAAKELAGLDRSTGRRIVERIHWLAASMGTVRTEALTGEMTGFYKLRRGDYRVIYELLREEETIVIHAIGHRREIYRRKLNE